VETTVNLLWKTRASLCVLAAFGIGAFVVEAVALGDSPREIRVDTTRVKGPLNRAYRFSVGSDRAIIHTRPEHQRDLRFVKETCGFEYMRFHGLLNEEMKLVKREPDGKLVYDWTNVDRVYDFLRKLGMRPIVELGFMPEPLASGEQTIFWWKGNVTAPKSYDEWGDFIEALTRHLTVRYGADEVPRWYFEVWNEPNLDGFWPGGQAEYFKLYEHAVRAVKRVDPAYRVGGPATAGGGWIKETLDYCEQNEVPIDFVATHTYGATEGFLDEEGKGGTMLDPNPEAVTNWFPSVLDPIRASKWPKLPVLVTEWGPSYSPRDPVHDSYFCAAYILQKLRRLPAGVEAMSYWTFSDQFEEPGPPSTPFHGGFGLLNVQGLPKAAYFAYRFLNELGDTELACEDANVWACRSDQGVQVLLWDYHQPKQDARNLEFFARELPAKETAPAQLVIDNLSPGKHTVKITRVGHRHNDVYTAYLDLGSPAGLPDSPSHLPEEVLTKLRAACAGTPETRDVTVSAGEPLVLDLPLNENDVYFVTIER
jgi:xylan 1,4-beta-xylosidase